MTLDDIKQQIMTLCAGISHPTIVLGLSGGPDSVLLFHALTDLYTADHISLIVAHLDHGWREESREDAQFCLKLAIRHNVPVHIAHVDDFKDQHMYNGSLEDVGRKMRRAFFERVQREHSANFIALGHNRDDQIETFFIRLIRGTTLAGITAMNPKDGAYIRPLLSYSKADILALLEKEHIEYREDVSNTSQEFLRNRIRSHVIPALRYCDSRFDDKFMHTLANLKRDLELLEEFVQSKFETIFNKELVGNLTTFKTLSPHLQRRVLLLLLKKKQVPFFPSQALLDELRRFLNSPRGGTHAVNTWTMHKRKNEFFITAPG